MQILDNVSHTVRDDLLVTMKKGSKVSIAAACFSIYAYQELKKELENVEELRFIFSSISPRLKSRGHKYFINKSHMLSFVLQFKRGGTLQSTWR